MKKIILIIVILAAAGGVIYWIAKPNFITYKDPGLTADQRKIYEDKIDLIQKEMSTFNASTTQYDQMSAYIQLGFQYYGLGEYTKAKELYLKAIEINPQEPNAYTALYQVQLDMQDFKGAKESIATAVTLESRWPDHWVKYLVLLESGELKISEEELIAVYSQALEAADPKTEIRVLFARHWEKKGDLEKALYHWQLAQADDTPNKAIYEQEAARVQALIDAQKNQ